MIKIPDDMLFYYSTTNGESFYFSANYWIKENKMQVVEILEDEFWELIESGNLKKEEISPADFRFPLPGNISGMVKQFVIK